MKHRVSTVGRSEKSRLRPEGAALAKTERPDVQGMSRLDKPETRRGWGFQSQGAEDRFRPLIHLVFLNTVAKSM